MILFACGFCFFYEHFRFCRSAALCLCLTLRCFRLGLFFYFADSSCVSEEGYCVCEGRTDDDILLGPGALVASVGLHRRLEFGIVVTLNVAEKVVAVQALHGFGRMSKFFLQGRASNLPM